jgi:hypothetical protein
LADIFAPRALESSRCRNSSARDARPETRRALLPQATASGWMIPGSTPAKRPEVASAGTTATQAVKSRKSSPASATRRTERTSPGS